MTVVVKRLTLLVGITSLLASSCFAQAPTPRAEARQSGTVLVLGDSIGAGYGVPTSKNWVTLLNQRAQSLYPGWKIVNGSVAGDTIKQGAIRLPGLLRQFQPSIVLIELGGNDGLRGARSSIIRQQLAQVAQAVQKAGAEPIIVGVSLPPNFGRRTIKRFREAIRSTAESLQVPYIDLADTEVGKQGAYLQLDRIHPNQSAQPILMEKVWKTLEGQL